MTRGIIVKAIGGFYFVSENENIYTCKIRGKLKRKDGGIMVGDYVDFEILNGEQGVVEDILPRNNSMIRPKIANVNQGLIILASKDPDPDFMLLDRLLIFMQRAGVEPVICFNKTDLLTADDEIYNALREYEEAGFTVVYASAATGDGKEQLAGVLKDRITVLAGPSGAGKSSTLNLQHSDFCLETGDVSEKLGRGKHTTRCVELLPLDGGWVADTPGFSRLDLPKDMQPEELGLWYPEFKRYSEKCRYDGCRHDREPECAVKEALEAGKISCRRYERYLMLLQELIAMREQEYK
ncbi:MAG: ribosome small subunit-dependent GTPase A [Bacillota bacterium]|jgi:ribosome biogenesis GTPase